MHENFLETDKLRKQDALMELTTETLKKFNALSYITLIII